MKKFLFVAVLGALVACGETSAPSATTDSPKVDSPVVTVDSPKVDSPAVVTVDSPKVDSPAVKH